MKQGLKLRIFKKKIRYKAIIFIQKTEKVLCHDYKVLNDCLRKDTFVSFFKDLVCKLPSHKNIIVMDNFSFHHSKEVKELAELSNKKILFSPPYSPQFNPIELLFSVMKKKYREFVRNESSFLKVIQLSIDI